jgi:hypothetical protein
VLVEPVAMKHFSVAYKPEIPIVFSSSGIPAWPVYTKKDLLTFQQVCKFYGAEWLLENNPVATGIHSNSSEEYVVAIGEKYKKDALLYAHLTSRKVVVLADTGELIRSYQPAFTVVIANHTDLDPHLLERLYTSDQVTAPGLILDYNDGHFFRQLLFKSLLYRITLTERDPDTVVDFLPTSAVKFFTHEKFIMAGSDMDTASTKHLLKMKKSLLNIVTHSDGIDAYLGKLTLCPLKEIRDQQQSSPPLCISTGICHRTQQPMQHPAQKGFLISPLKIRTKILLWLTCRGIRLRPSSINPAWGILPVFASNPFIGSLVTPWKIIYTNLEMMKQFSHFLNESGTLGKAVAAFNQSEISKTTNLKLSVIGDPNIYFHGNQTMTAVHELISGNMLTTTQTEAANAPAHFIQQYLQIIQNKTGNGNAPEIKKCLELLNEKKSTTSKNKASCKLLGKQVLDIISHQKNEAVVDYVKQAKHIQITKNNTICPYCQVMTDTHSISFHHSHIEKRWVTICPCCGIIEDRDNNAVPAQLKVSGGKVSLINHAGLKTNFDAVLKYDFKLKGLSHTSTWPKDDQGFPKEYVELNTTLHPGPLYITLFILQDLKFSMTRLPYRQELN